MQLLVKGKTPQQFINAVQWRLRLNLRRKRLSNLRKGHKGHESTWITHTNFIQYILKADQAREILLRHSQEHPALIAEAEQVCADLTEVPGFGKRSIVLSHNDFSNPAEAYAFRLLCRLDFLRTLTRAHLISSDKPVYIAKLEQFITEWADRHSQPGRFDSVDEAIRILNLLETLALTQGRISDEAYKAGLKSVLDAAWTVEANRARTGNHLIYEGLALFYAGSCLADYFRSDSWQNLGKAILEHEMRHQVLDDGMNGELCTSYHLITGTNFLKGWVLGEKTGNRFPDSFTNQLAKMAMVASQLRAGDGGFFALGDSDRMNASSREESEASVFADLGRVITHSDSDKESSLEFDFLLAGLDTSILSIAESHSDKNVLSAGGYNIFKYKNKNTLVFDTGPFGLPGASHHGHADSLSFKVHLGSDRFLVDPGGFSYVDEKARDFARSTAAHNTIRIDGKDSSEITGSFSYGRTAEAWLTDYYEVEGAVVFCAEHDGYARLPSPVIHRRGIVWLTKHPLLLLVFDRLDGKDRHLIESFFHGEISWRVEPKDDLTLSWNKENRTIIQHFGSGCDLTVDILRGKKDPEWQGWVSPAYGEYLEAPTVVQRCESVIPTEIVNVFNSNDKMSIKKLIDITNNTVIIDDKLKLCWKWNKNKLSINLA